MPLTCSCPLPVADPYLWLDLTSQVLLAEWLSREQPEIKYVTCHPGWTDTPGVEAAFGSQKRILQPLRSLWQGTEGIAWLCGCAVSEIEAGERRDGLIATTPSGIVCPRPERHTTGHRLRCTDAACASLEPLRIVTGALLTVTGAFYLDRTVQPKHIAGPFFTEGSFTKNTEEEVRVAE